MRKFTKTDPTSSGWHSGSRFGVCLAAWIPATRATASTSPLVMAPEAIRDGGLGLHVDPAAGDGPPVARLLGGDVDHPGPSERVEVGELGRGHVPQCMGRGPARPGRGPIGPPAARRVASAADLAHRARRADEVDLADAVPGPLRAHRAGDRRRDASSTVGGRAPRIAAWRAQVGLVEREQAGAEPALGGDPDPVAVAAERLGDAGDDADVAPPSA